MRRLAAIALLVVAVPTVLAMSLGASGDATGYKVRALFDNASFVVAGEDVKVAGVEVGRVDSLDVSEDKKAVLVLDITDKGFQPFHADAQCTVRPQSLIGERYVECDPGTDSQPELGLIPEGEEGEGQRLLPLSQTSSPIDIDLVNNIMRLPIRQRFALIINEFGTGLAGRGEDLKEAIHRANPALRETDKVLAILARQNRLLADLAADSDAVIEPLAERREDVSHFVVAANETGQATAERAADMERTLERLPVFLRELDPLLRDLGAVTDASTPVLEDLETAAPDLTRFTRELGPFAQAGTPALISLGEATEIGRPALVDSLPTVRKLADFAENAKPVARNLDDLSASLDKTGGIERLMDYLLFQMTAINGFDGVSHYLRAGLITNLCSSYSPRPISGCNSNFTQTEAVEPSSAAPDDPILAKTRAALAANQAPYPKGGDAPERPDVDPFDALRSLTDPKIARQRDTGLDGLREGSRGSSPAHGPADARTQALDYLLGNEGR
jgi:virulence factor Mce-like protein